MRTIRRRAASPTLAWKAAGPNRQYRIGVRNEETGEKRNIYEGFRQQCRLPPELRLTPDQLSYRVESRDAEDPNGPWRNVQPFTRIPRIGDELNPGAADVLRDEETAGATAYRFQIREALSEDLLIDMIVEEPWALLPVGAIRERETEWIMRPRVAGRWTRGKWRTVSEEAAAAARLRADTLIVLQDEERARPEPGPVTWPVPAEITLPAASPRAPSLAIAVAVSAMPQLAPEPTPQSVFETQWSDGHSSGAAERVARMLEAANLKGWFFLDVELADALDPSAVPAFGERLAKRGHEIGLYIGEGLLAPEGLSIPQRLERMLANLPTRAHVGVMLGAGPDREAWLRACVDAGVATVVASRAAILGLAEWMHWRTTAFAVAPGTIVIPTATFLSTPAHARDRVVRHSLDNRDAMAAANLSAIVAAAATLEATRLVVAEVDPLLMMDKRSVADPDAAHAWNSTLKQLLPAWFALDWKRSTTAYEMARNLSEIRLHLLTGMLENLNAAPLAWAKWSDVFDRNTAAGWLSSNTASEPIIEKRRGPRRMRRSAVRRYDNAYRLSLRAES